MSVVPVAVGIVRSGPVGDHLWYAAAWLVACGAYQRFGERSVVEPVPPTRSRRRAGLGWCAGAVLLVLPLVALRPDLVGWIVAVAVAGCQSHLRRRAAGADPSASDVLAAVAAALAGLGAYQAGYPDGGTILAGWTSVVAMQAAALIVFVGMALSRAAQRATVPVWAVIGWHLLWAAAFVALARWAHHPPGLSARGMTSCAALFILLIPRSVLVARTLVPVWVVGAGDLLAWGAFLGVVWRWL